MAMRPYSRDLQSRGQGRLSLQHSAPSRRDKGVLGLACYPVRYTFWPAVAMLRGLDYLGAAHLQSLLLCVANAVSKLRSPRLSLTLYISPQKLWSCFYFDTRCVSNARYHSMNLLGAQRASQGPGSCARATPLIIYSIPQDNFEEIHLSSSCHTSQV
jgi:hypothetical protein